MGKEDVHIVIENDGPGFNPNAISTSHSIANTRKRLEILLHGTLTIQSQPEVTGVKVEIIIPSQQINQ